MKARQVGRVGLLLMAGALLLTGCGSLSAPGGTATGDQATGATAKVSRGTIEQTVSATANVAARREVTLSFASSGPVAEVAAEEGQAVAAGQVLTRLDTTTLEWQAARAEASLATAQARLAQAQQAADAAELSSAQAAVDSAQANYDKVQAGATTEELTAALASLDSAQANYDKVKAGPTDDELASARAAVDSAEAGLAQAQAAYDQVKDRPDVGLLPQALNLQSATIEYERARANYDAQADRPTASDLAAAQAQLVQAETQLAQLRDRPTASELAAAASQLAQAEAQLAQVQDGSSAEDLAVMQAQVAEAEVALAQARDQIEDATIVAPFAGTVVTVQAQAGEWAQPGAPAVIVAETGALMLDLNVDESDVAQIAAGQLARLSFEALPGQEVTGTVIHIAPASTNVSGAVAYGIEIAFDPGDLPVRLGMTADVRIVTALAEEALLVPNRAVTADREAGRYYVTRQRGGSEQRLEVRIGLRDEQQTQILAGVDEGDALVLPILPAQGSEESGTGFGMMRPGGRP